MGLSTIIGLYASRIVLQVLGVADFGIYSVVGGIVMFMMFLNTSMSSATSRFITFELGNNNKQRLNETFNSALIVHIAIALVILVLAETIGLWFLNNKLVIPENQMNAAQWVYQISILTAIIGITQVPYSACIIAHEKMGIYAYIEIFNAVLKLAIIYLLIVVPYTKLIVYAWLVFGSSVIVTLIYRFYCIHQFAECKFHFGMKKEILAPMLSFSGWDLYSSFCLSAKVPGVNFIINVFFGVILNTAASIANSVSEVIYGFTSNVLFASQPSIIKNYAANDINKMQYLTNKTIKYTIILAGCFIMPLLLELNYVMQLWLSVVPPQSVQFCRIILLTTIITLITEVLVICIRATGKMKLLALVSGTLHLVSLLMVYILFINSLPPISAFWVMFIFMGLILACDLAILSYLIPQLSIKAIISNILLGISVIAVSIIPAFIIWSMMQENFARLCAVTLSYLVVLFIISYFLIFEQSVKDKIRSTLFNHIVQ